MLATDELMSVPSFVGALLLLAVAGVRLNKQSLSAWRAIGGPSPFSATQRIRFSDVLSSRSDFVWSTFSRFLNSHTRGPQEPLSRPEVVIEKGDEMTGRTTSVSRASATSSVICCGIRLRALGWTLHSCFFRHVVSTLRREASRRPVRREDHPDATGTTEAARETRALACARRARFRSDARRSRARRLGRPRKAGPTGMPSR